MFAIVLSSNSKFSKALKSDVSNILVELRKQNQLVISNDTLMLASTGATQQNLITNTALLNDGRKLDYCVYTNFEDALYVKHLLSLGAHIILNPYLKMPAYAFIILLATDEQYIIIKFGFTDDIIERINTLKSEYSANVFLVGLRLVKSESCEKRIPLHC